MAKWIKNNSGTTKSYLGQQINNQAYYEIQSDEENRWAADSTLIKDIANDVARVAKDDSGNTDFLDVNDAITYLKDGAPQKQHIILTQDSLSTKDTGMNFTASAGTTHTEDKLVDFKYLRGGILETENHQFPDDTVSVEIVDKDNVLGYGPGLVVNEFIKNVPVRKAGIIEITSHAISNPITPGLYFRVIYNSVGSTDVKVALIFYGYNDA